MDTLLFSFDFSRKRKAAQQNMLHALRSVFTLIIALLVTSYTPSGLGQRLSPSAGDIALPIIGQSLTASNGSVLSVPVNASAVALNVTAVNPSAAGFITVWPCGVDRPLASHLNYASGSIVPNGVIASIGANGGVCFFSQAESDLIVDIAGWFEGSSYVGATPNRLVDTRDGTGGSLGFVDSSEPLVVTVAGLAVTSASGSAVTIPSNLSAVALNVTAVTPVGNGFLTVWPCDVARPLASNVNYTTGAIVPNGVIAPVSADGTVCIFSQTPSHVIVDLAGWFPGAAFEGSTPTRLIDTRDGTGGTSNPIGGLIELSVPIHGITLDVEGVSRSLPSSGAAAALNVTVVGPAAAGFATVWPCGVTRPTASNLNFSTGQVIANNIIAPIGSDGSICFFSSASTDIIVDISGWFSGDEEEAFVGVTPERFVDTRINLGPAPGVPITLEADTAEAFFTESLHNQVIVTRCRVCHVQGGIAGNTPLLYTGIESEDFETVRTYVATDSDAANRILDKSRGVAHGGGAVLASGSTEYLNLVEFLVLLEAQVNSNSLSSEAFWNGVNFANAPQTVRRASVIAAGKVPEGSALDVDEPTLRAALRELLQGEGFHDFLIHGANDRLHTDAFLNGLFMESADLNAVAILPVGANKYSSADVSTEEGRRTRNHWQNQWGNSMARAPLELIAHVVENELPYTEILTANYTMVTPISSEILRSEVIFDTGHPYEFKPGPHRGQVLRDEQLQAEFIQGQGQVVSAHGDFVVYPHAGVLNTQAFLNRYPSTETNRNRARSRWTYYFFLGVDIEKSAARSTDPEALADTNNPTLNNPNCTVCHQIMDPISGAFQNYGDEGLYRSSRGGLDSLPGSYKHPQYFDIEAPPSPYVEGDTWYRDMLTPGIVGAAAPDPRNSLQWLAQEITQDPRFAVATVKFWWPSVMGSQILEAPEVVTDISFTDQLAAFEAQNEYIQILGEAFQTGIHGGAPYNLKDMIVEMMMSPWFRANSIATSSGDATVIGSVGSLRNIGTRRLLTPSELEKKVQDLLGWRWNEYPDEYSVSRRFTALANRYNIYFGGIDSLGIQERAIELTPLMFNVAERMAVQMACPAVMIDLNTPDADRRFFKGITTDITPTTEFSRSFEVTGIGPEEALVYISTGQISVGNRTLNISFLNDFYSEDLGDRNLIVDRLTISDSTGEIAFRLELEDIESHPGAIIGCGAPYFSGASGTVDAFNIWSECSLTIPVDISKEDDYRISVEAYGQQAGPELTQMQVSIESNDPYSGVSAGGQAIKQKLVEWHERLLGETLSIDDPEIQASYNLLVETWEARLLSENPSWAWNGDIENCHFPSHIPDPWAENGIGHTGADPTAMKNTWTSMLIYFMTDFKFIHE
ncbi:MAG: hypothetical protein ACJAVI_003204 [Candidatus Azotimanducaceae bacterium]|jgi:hypothetical protein